MPSQRSAADDGSRNRSRHLADSDVAEAQISLWTASKARRLASDTKRGSDVLDGTLKPTASDKRIIKSKPKLHCRNYHCRRSWRWRWDASLLHRSTDASTSGLVKAIQRRLDEASEDIAKDIHCPKEKVWPGAKSESKGKDSSGTTQRAGTGGEGLQEPIPPSRPGADRRTYRFQQSPISTKPSCCR